MPVNGATAPSVGILQTYLDSVYRQANVKFTVTEKTGFRFNLDTNNVAGLERAGSGINKYSAEMRILRDKFASDTTYDKKANYIFVVSAFEGGGLDGFMVRGRSMGFVASGASKRTYAHELGHGAFGLEHTFPEIGQSLSNNLMDYGDSTHLTHKQCKDIAKRKFVFNWLDSEEDAAIWNFVIGGAVSGTVDILLQVLGNYITNEPLGNISWSSVAISVAAGAASSGEAAVGKLIAAGANPIYRPLIKKAVEVAFESIIETIEDVVRSDNSTNVMETFVTNLLTNALFMGTGDLLDELHDKLVKKYKLKKSLKIASNVVQPSLISQTIQNAFNSVVNAITRYGLQKTRVKNFKNKITNKANADGFILYLHNSYKPEIGLKALDEDIARFINEPDIAILLIQWAYYAAMYQKIGSPEYNAIITQDKVAFKNWLIGLVSGLPAPSCIEFSDSENKATSPLGGMTPARARSAVNKLCVAITDAPTRRLINEELKKYPAKYVKSFFDDVLQTPCRDTNICAKLPRLTANHIVGWKIIQEGKGSANLNSYLAKNYQYVSNMAKSYTFYNSYNTNAKTNLVGVILAQRTYGSGIKSFIDYLSEITKMAATDSIIVNLGASTVEEAFNMVIGKRIFASPANKGSTTEVNLPTNAGLQELVGDRKAAQTAFKDACKNNDEVEAKAQMKIIIAKSEDAAEAVADAHYIAQGYIKLDCKLPGDGKQGQFDRVYGKRNAQNVITDLIVVECKGGSSPLGGRGNMQQGSKAYLINIIENMELKAPRDNSLLRETTTALFNVKDIIPVPPIQYILVQQPFDDNGNLKPTKITPFIL